MTFHEREILGSLRRVFKDYVTQISDKTLCFYLHLYPEVRINYKLIIVYNNLFMCTTLAAIDL